METVVGSSVVVNDRGIVGTVKARRDTIPTRLGGKVIPRGSLRLGEVVSCAEEDGTSLVVA
ncbi:hypothetical protein BH23PLA1_BH23PLA1_15700 [soil metagenome]